ncbi:MAG: sigma-54-dependent Fis family transcriptional regulator [Chitinispirillaceae bacterium]|nr:sigma-54-dependent Fis family transcriptional regulator [Chitinispirillaceae bacterium]
MNTVLIVEDNAALREQMKWALQGEYSVLEADSSASCAMAVEKHNPDLVCLDMGLDNIPDKGLVVIDAVLTLNRRAKIIVITANTSETLGAEAIRRGAFDYLKKPVDIDHLKVILSRAVRLLSFQAEPLENGNRPGIESAPSQYIIGQSESMRHIFELVRKLGMTDVNVLITGESGTGKEVCARAIHHNSPRREQPFVPINCGAIPETLLESELFGYTKGAFTGAVSDKKGLIESAENGTLFLDEIGDMPKNLQVKLLRFIEDQKYQPLGSMALLSSNVRIIAATHSAHAKDAEKGVLRSDLYYRLSEFEIHLPPLRERGEDVLLLAGAIIERNREKFNLPRLALSSRAKKALQTYAWPGNVRELENKLSRAAIVCVNQTIEEEDLQLSSGADMRMGLKDAREQFEKEYLQKALQKSHFVISTAAELLGISRPTLYDMIKKHGISVKEPSA